MHLSFCCHILSLILVLYPRIKWINHRLHIYLELQNLTKCFKNGVTFYKTIGNSKSSTYNWLLSELDTVV